MKALLFLSTAFLLTASVRAQPVIRKAPTVGFSQNFRTRQHPELDPIEKAVRDDDAPKVLELLRANPKLRFSMGMRHDGLRFTLLSSPMEAAIQSNSPKVVRALLQSGSDANIGLPYT